MTNDYDSDDWDDNFLPLKIGDIKKVYNHLADQDGGLYVFNDVDDEEPATILDFNSLLLKLQEHYTISKEPINITDSQSLIFIFDSMAEYFSLGPGSEKDDQADMLFSIFDGLSEVFGKKSDYDLTNEAVQQLFDTMNQNKEVQKRFEGTMIENFNDLVEMEKKRRDEKITELFNELYAEEEEATTKQMELADEVEDVEDVVENIAYMLEYDEERQAEMEEMIEQSKELL